MKKVNVISLGCSKNLVDTELLLKQLGKAGYLTETDVENSDAEIVVVTHEVAEKKFMDAIKKFSSMEMVKEISSIIRVYALGNV